MGRVQQGTGRGGRRRKEVREKAKGEGDGYWGKS